MAELFVMTFDVGSGAPVDTITGLIADIDVLCRASRELAVRAAEYAVGELIIPFRGAVDLSDDTSSSLTRLGNILREISERQQEIKRSSARELANIEREANEWGDRLREEIARQRAELEEQPPEVRTVNDEYLRAIQHQDWVEEAFSSQVAQRKREMAERFRSRETEELAALKREQDRVLQASLPVSGEQAYQVLWPLIERAVRSDEEIIISSYVSDLVPEQPYRFRSVQYANPLVLEILSGIGFASVSLAYLMRVIRDWSAGRRRSLAAAADVENEVQLKARLRQTMIEQVSTGELPLTPEIINSLILSSKGGPTERLAETIERLAARSPAVGHREIED
jgi:hypothetical protein